MKKWLKKIGQSFLREDEAKDKEAFPPAVEQVEIKDKEAFPPAVEQVEIRDKEAIPPAIEQEDTTKIHTQKSWFNKLGDNFKRTSSNIRKAIFRFTKIKF